MLLGANSFISLHRHIHTRTHARTHTLTHTVCKLRRCVTEFVVFTSLILKMSSFKALQNGALRLLVLWCVFSLFLELSEAHPRSHVVSVTLCSPPTSLFPPTPFPPSSLPPSFVPPFSLRKQVFKAQKSNFYFLLPDVPMQPLSVLMWWAMVDLRAPL